MNDDKDYSLYSGERQVGRSLDEIRRDHIVRYELVVKLMNDFSGSPFVNCLDLFCGNGYGTHMISKNFPNSRVLGIDGSEAAINQANELYSLMNNLFSWKLFPFKLPQSTYNIIVCFESLEHVEDDASMLKELLGALIEDGIAIVSVPNQAHHPLEKNPHKFHFRHYHHAEFLDMVPEGFSLVCWFGQNSYVFTGEGLNTFTLLPDEEVNLNKEQFGQVSIYVLRRDKK